MSMIETERLILRPFVMADLDALHRIVSHPDVWQYDPGYERSRDETRALLVFRIGELQRHGIGRLAVTLKQTGALIGYCGLQLCLVDYPTYTTPEIELFYGLAREHWGQGLITEAAHALVAHGFETQKLRRIVSCARGANTRSIGVMHRVGMRVEADPGDPEHRVMGVIERVARGTTIGMQTPPAPPCAGSHYMK
jgi:RimJ/RimL family protein N-acetyltransferase